MVHGDIRPLNILVDAGEGPLDSRIKIIDFEGEVRYPLDLTLGQFMSEVKDWGMIKATHDISMVEKL